jgi:hypothetical protein
MATRVGPNFPDNRTNAGTTAWATAEGLPYPLGVSWCAEDRAYNFALYSKHATAVRLLLFGDELPCGGRRSVVAFVADAGQAHSLLVTLGLPADSATFAPARDPPQAELAWEDPA